ncbi:MAG: ABC transporter permease [Saprospiraceae bacterium]|nr:ABC transporter permease [Saprospiraceae bacterium]
MQIQVYSAKSKSNLWRTLKAIGTEFPVAHALGFRFAQRNIRARYRQSLLGIVWALIPPLATAAIWIFLNQKNIVSLNHTGSSYALFVITGTMLWSIFSNAVTMPIQSIQANAPILVKVNFPREALMITAFYEIVFTALISLLIIAAEIVIFQIPVTGYTFLFIPAVLVLIMLGMCFGLLLLPFAILYKDIQFALPAFLQIALYATPVVYATTELSGGFKFLALNPVSPVLVSARDWLLGLQSSTGLLTLGCIGLVTFVILVAGFILQRITMEILIERMGT